ncbi:WD repeat-containing and planar cell polarity effector protein fritz homolog [Parasteatoda tepidariorum]|uniref:WD repeat-containing and planar cell polarity effector protein fritz homolog n=1 Tax=Parasteatoda tepidariorum TaxID=114398 RepID=UPI001C71AC53|nr:WD repeat-containing and planar cell polarity effector protein fritz homolog [Parasteatoda tepidariorum]
MTKMTSLLTSLYLLSFKEVEIPHNAEVDCIKVSKRDNCVHYPYGKEKKELSQSQTKKSKKNWGSKRSTIEKLFRSYKSIFLSWDSNQPLKIFFSNGSIVSIKLSNDNNSLEKIDIDNNLVGKFIPSRIVDAIIVNNNIYVTYCEPKLTLINLNQDHSSLSSKILGLKKGILAGSEVKINHFDLIGPCNKSIERKLSLNTSNDNLLVWWKSNSDDVFPWVPVAYSTDRINMTVYDINDSFQVLCTVKTHGELIQADYSKLYSNQILTLEKVKGESCDDINVCVYEIIDNHCYHTFVSKLPLRGNLLSCDWSSNEKLLVSDSDHLLLIYDLKKRTSVVTNLLYLPKQIAWHPQNSIAFVIGVDSQLQCFDSALTCVKFQMRSSSHLEHHLININSYFLSLFTVQKILWQKSKFKNSCMFLLDSEISSILILNVCTGCFTQNNLGVMELCSQYLKSNLIDEAILLLRSLSWSHEGELSFQCLSKIANCLFRKPFNSKNQIGLEVALGTYYDSIDNLSKHVIKIYQHRIRHIARRFFHYLLRNLELRKAFLLAVDLESQDLFLDLYNIAKRKKENVLALVALQKAEEFNLSSESYSTTSSSCDYESATSSDDSEENYRKPEYTTDRLLNSNYLFNQNQYGLPVSGQALLTENWINTSNHVVQTPEPFQNDALASTSGINRGKLKARSDKDSYSSIVYSDADLRHGMNLTFSIESQTSSQTCDIKYSQAGTSSGNFSSVGGPDKTYSNFNSDIRVSSSSYEGNPPNAFKNVKVHPTSTMRPLPPFDPRNSNKSGSSGEIYNVHHKKDMDNLKQEENILVSCRNKIYDDDTEELEDSRIKLVHFGII